jgi:uncharacterized membrane protein YesL
MGERFDQPVRFLRLFLRGMKDVYDQFVLMMVVSVLWWISVALLVPGPPATVALFRITDPRNQVSSPEIRDFFLTIRETFKTAWAIAGITIPVILVLLWNSLFFRESDSRFALIVPLWFVMILLTFILMMYALATVAVMESRARNAFRGGTYLMVMWPFTSGLLIVCLALVLVLFAALVLPLILFGPAVGAAVINRFVLAGYNIDVIDPSSPTSERSTEVSSGVNLDGGFRGWAKRARGGSAAVERRR